MTALLDTRRALEDHVSALGDRVETSRREITETISAQVSTLHADNRETRNRVGSVSTSLSEINKTLPSLRQDVVDLARMVHELRDALSDLSAQIPASSAPVENPAHERGQLDQEPESSASSDTPLEPVVNAAPSANIASDTVAAAPSNAGDSDVEQDAAYRQAITEEVADADKYEDEDSGRAALTASEKDLADHDIVLGTAATVGTVHLVCHRDLWDFIQEHAADVPHFRAPATPSEEGADRLRITMSGRSVIGVLIAMRSIRPKTAPYGKDDGTWVLSGAVYRRLAHDLKTTSRDGGEPLTVVFDDGVDDGVEDGSASQ